MCNNYFQVFFCKLLPAADLGKPPTKYCPVFGSCLLGPGSFLVR